MDGTMGGATVGQWGSFPPPPPTEMRLRGQSYVIAPAEIRRARSERYTSIGNLAPTGEKSWRRPWMGLPSKEDRLSIGRCTILEIKLIKIVCLSGRARPRSISRFFPLNHRDPLNLSDIVRD